MSSVMSIKWNDNQCLTNCKKSHFGYNTVTPFCISLQLILKPCNPITKYNPNTKEIYYPTTIQNIWCDSRCGKFSTRYSNKNMCIVDMHNTNIKWVQCDPKDPKIINKTVLNLILFNARNSQCYLKKMVGKIPTSFVAQHRNIFHYTLVPSWKNTSIISYSTIDAPSLPGYRNNKITIKIRACIFYQHLKQPSYLMKSNTSRSNYLIALSLGGTNDDYNIVSAIQSVHWYAELEKEIREFLNIKGRKVDLQIMIHYNDLQKSRIPLGFNTQTIFYNSNNTINKHSGSCYYSVSQQTQRPQLSQQPQRPQLSQQPQRPQLSQQPQRPQLSQQPQRPQSSQQPQRPQSSQQTQQPKPQQPKPQQPKPQQPKPQQPKPQQPKPQQPKPRQPKPRQPKPRQPKPQQPKPRQPKPRQPKPRQPKPQPPPRQPKPQPPPRQPKPQPPPRQPKPQTPPRQSKPQPPRQSKPQPPIDDEDNVEGSGEFYFKK
jgi:hypothetical protein